MGDIAIKFRNISREVSYYNGSISLQDINETRLCSTSIRASISSFNILYIYSINMPNKK